MLISATVYRSSCVTCHLLCGITVYKFICLVPDVMVGMGFTREEVRESLITQKYNEVTATYLLLGRKNEVNVSAWRFSYLFCFCFYFVINKVIIK